MNKGWWKVVSFVLSCGALVLVAAGCAGDSAARAAIEKAFPGAAIDEMELEREGGVELYEAELTQDGKEFEVEVAPDGTIVEVETAVALGELPKAAAAALKKAAGRAPIGEIDKVEVRAERKDGKFVPLDSPKVIYEAKVGGEGKQKEIRVAADGTILAEEADD